MRASWWGPALTGGEPVHSNASALVGILPQLQVAKNTSQGSGGAGTSQLGLTACCLNSYITRDEVLAVHA